MKYLTRTLMAAAVTLGTSLTATANESLIPYTSEKDATGKVKKVYGEVKGAFGMLPAPMKQYSANPALLTNQWEMYKVVGSNKNFSEQLTAMMRMSVASAPALDCDYCIGLNESMLLNMFKMDMKEINAVKKDPHTATSLNDKDKKMLIFMVESTTKPKEVNKAQVDELRTLGWTNKDIFDGLKMATQMVAMTLMVDTLKIPRDF